MSWYTVLTHKIFTLSTAKGSGTARRFAAAGRCLRGHTKRFRARLEGPATWLSRGIVIQAACAFETFCELVNLGSSQNPCPEQSEGFTQITAKGSGTASRRFVSCWPVPEVHPEYTEGTEGAQKTCFWARLEGPAAWL